MRIMEHMKLALILSASLAACSASPPDLPDVTMPDLSLLQRCGRPPTVPAMWFRGSPIVMVPIREWNDHINWAASVNSWAKCADASPDVIPTCGMQPAAPAWKVAFGTDPDLGEVANLDPTFWAAHTAWTSAMDNWTTCADATNPD